jgi:hypothetical protein
MAPETAVKPVALSIGTLAVSMGMVPNSLLTLHIIMLAALVAYPCWPVWWTSFRTYLLKLRRPGHHCLCIHESLCMVWMVLASLVYTYRYTIFHCRYT